MSAVTVRKKNKYKVRDAFKFQKTVGGSNERCCVPLCVGSSHCEGKLSFHRLPRDSELQWLDKICRMGFSTNEIMQPTFQIKIRIWISAKGRQALAASTVPSSFEWNNYANGKTRADVWEHRTWPTSSPDPSPMETEDTNAHRPRSQSHGVCQPVVIWKNAWGNCGAETAAPNAPSGEIMWTQQ